jgi:cell wall-associated NlpC family hydrolase
MKTRLALALAVCLAINTGVTTTSTATPKPQKQLQFDLAQQLFKERQKARLTVVIKYLTTKVHKTPYRFAGSTTKGWDCSGLVRYTYKQVGITLPHSAHKQGHVGKRVSTPKAGDIIVFAYQGSTQFYHSAIYLGNDLLINANLYYKTTVIQPLSDFKKSQIRFVRIIND